MIMSERRNTLKIFNCISSELEMERVLVRGTIVPLGRTTGCEEMVLQDIREARYG